ncbi:hypothetical protein B9T62_19000 [Paenibacillus donghaensis]|uniref:Uncharacterized protein n=2 Tax=Paenibacillus donghaensis TaxID=414771 RepID=A0A2Z2KFE2_9BACL|nr:hypothetical protein [Paenibacillus donghaensis]ASA22695.1 hypothetical protein B9T62_19000 [Paenibacillus donghaensis]
MNNEDSNTLYIMTYTLNSGIKNTVPLSNSQIDEWMQCYKNDEKFVTTIGAEYFGLNSNLVADFKVHNKFSVHRNQIVSIQKTEEEILNKAYSNQTIVIKVDCKCGTTYTAESQYKRKTWNCSKCKEIVYLVEDVLVDTNKGKGHLMSNKMRIEY